MAGIDVKMFLLGVVLLAVGLILAWVEFALPEYFFGWFALGLAGPLVWGLFAILIIVGGGLIYGGLKPEPATEVNSCDYPLIDEFIDEEGDDYVAEEKMICRKYMNSDECLLAVFSGNVDEENELDRMMLTDKRAIFYSRGESQPARSFQHSEIVSIKTKKGKLLTHLGEIKVHAKGEMLTFKNVQAQYLDHIVETFSRMKTSELHTPEAPPQYCENCGNPVKQGDKFCRNCGKNLPSTPCKGHDSPHDQP